MKTIGNKIVIRRGETFKLSCKLYMDDCETPYILRKGIPNQYLCIIITSTTLNVDKRYRCTYWLDLSKYPKFKRRKAEPISSEDLAANKLSNGYASDTCVFYILYENGTKEYYYYNSDNKYEPYEFKISKLFLNKDTNDLIESNYNYQFVVVGGTASIDTYKSIYTELYPDRLYIPQTESELREEICKIQPDFAKQFKPNVPISNYFIYDELRKPEQLIVKSNL